MSNDVPTVRPLAAITPREIGELAAQNARDALLDEFEQQGVTRELMASIGHELLEATKTVVQYDKGSRAQYGPDGELREEGREPGFLYSMPLKDNVTRFNTLKLLMEFHDVMPSKKIDVNDRRQTRELAQELMAAISKEGMLGVEDKGRQIHGPAPGEVALMGEMVKRRKLKRASLSPLDMVDEEEA